MAAASPAEGQAGIAVSSLATFKTYVFPALRALVNTNETVQQAESVL